LLAGGSPQESMVAPSRIAIADVDTSFLSGVRAVGRFIILPFSLNGVQLSWPADTALCLWGGAMQKLCHEIGLQF
jgi:hypothetical protein